MRRSSITVLGLALTAGGFVWVGGAPDASANSTVVASDDFAGSRASGWTDARVGGAYTYTSARGVSESARAGVIDLTRSGEGRDIDLPKASATDVTMTSTVKVQKLPTAGGGVRYGLATRQQGRRSYDAVVRVTPAGSALLSLSRIETDGSRTRLTQDATLATKVTPTSTLRLTIAVRGSDVVDLTADAALVESQTTTSSRPVPAPTTAVTRAVAAVKRATASLERARSRPKAKSKKARAKARRALARARAGEREARRAHAALRNKRVTVASTTERSMSNRTVTAKDSSDARITGAGHVGVWAYTSGDGSTARLGVTSLQATAHRVSVSTPPAPPAPPKVNRAPAASFTASTDGLGLAVDASASSDPDGPVAGYRWSFGDGTSATGRQSGHAYEKSGTYTVTLTVTDAEGLSSSTDRTVKVTAPNVAPVAAMRTEMRHLVLEASAQGSRDEDGELAAYRWDLGDGSTSTERAVTHTYALPGSYTVTLTVTDDDGATSTTTTPVEAVEETPPPNALPDPSFTVKATGLSVAVDGSASKDADGTVQLHEWDFGDGGRATGPTSRHTYDRAGSYVVTLTVTDDDGASATATRTVLVEAPVATKPSAATTGVPAGTRLTRHDGSMTITRAGTVIDGLDIYGNVTVKAANVTIRNSRIHGVDTSYATGLVTNYGYANLVIEDTYISPDTPSVRLDGIKGSDYTARRVHIVGGVDSAKVQGDNVLIEDSLLENTHWFANDPYQNGGATHNDNIQIQTGRNVVVSGNTIRGSQNFAVLGAASIGHTPGLRVVGNWVNDGHCTMKFEQYKSFKLSVLVKDNMFGPNRKVRSCPMVATPDSDFTAENNLWEADGKPVPYLRVANG